MKFADVRRQHIARTISGNPVEIQINRTKSSRSGGGFDESQESLPPFTGRIYMSRLQMPRTISTRTGTKQVDTIYGLLAPETADIRAGTDAVDVFELHGESFEIIAVNPQWVDGELVGFQADLERVD